MIEFKPFHHAHLKHIKVHSVQTEEWAALLGEEAAAAFASGPALSVWQSGVCLGAAGLVFHWKGRAEAWALLAAAPGVAVTKAVVARMRLVLDLQTVRRIDMSVRENNAHGHRLAKMMGFTLECKLEAYHPSGDDMYMYKRIKR